MKTLAFLLANALALVPLLSKAQQHVWRVNNDPIYTQGCAQCFSNLQEAFSNAPDGDTLHVEASPIPYGENILLNKHLVIIGPGYKLGMASGNNPNLQASSETATVGSIILSGAVTSGTVVSGLVFYQNGGSPGLYLEGASNVRILRNQFANCSLVFGNTTGVSNILVNGNYFQSAGITTLSNDQTVSNVEISNNYVEGVILLDQTFSDVVIAQNVLTSVEGSYNVHNADFYNNVLTNASGTVPPNTNNIHHCTARSPTGLPASIITNYNGVNPNLVFIPTGSDDSKWNILPGSSYAEGNGQDDYDRGMFDGAMPYQLSGIPFIPSIYHLQSPGSAMQSDSLNVVVGTRSNN